MTYDNVHLAGVEPRHHRHQRPRVLLVLGGGRGGEVGRDGVEQRPGLVAQLHPVWWTLVVILGDLDSSFLGYRGLVSLDTLTLLVITGPSLCA